MVHGRDQPPGLECWNFQISNSIAADLLLTSIHSSQSSASFSITLTFVLPIDSVACIKEREVICGRMKIEGNNLEK